MKHYHQVFSLKSLQSGSSHPYGRRPFLFSSLSVWVFFSFKFLKTTPYIIINFLLKTKKHKKKVRLLFLDVVVAVVLTFTSPVKKIKEEEENVAADVFGVAGVLDPRRWRIRRLATTLDSSGKRKCRYCARLGDGGRGSGHPDGSLQQTDRT